MCRGEPLLLPATAANHRQSEPQRLHTTRIPLQIQVALADSSNSGSCVQHLYQHMGNNVSHETEPLYLWLQRIYGYMDLFLWRLRFPLHIICFLQTVIRDHQSKFSHLKGTSCHLLEQLKKASVKCQRIHSQVTGGGSKNINTCPVQCHPTLFTCHCDLYGSLCCS